MKIGEEVYIGGKEEKRDRGKSGRRRMYVRK